MFATRVAFWGQGSNINVVALTRDLVVADVWTWTASGFGTRFANPTLPAVITPGSAVDINFSKDNNFLVTSRSVQSGSNRNGLLAYLWSNAYGFGTLYSSPADTFEKACGTVEFSPGVGSIATVLPGDSSSNSLSAWRWSINGFGTKYTSPTDANTNYVTVTFSPDGTKIAVARDGRSPFPSEYIKVYNWSDSAGFGTKQSSLSGSIYAIGLAYSRTSQTLAYGITTSPFMVPTPSLNAPTNQIGRGIKFTNSNNVISVGSGTNTSPYVYAYRWTQSTQTVGTKFANPAILPIDKISGIDFDKTDSIVFLSQNGTNFSSGLSNPGILAYVWDNSTGFGTQYASPTTITSFGKAVSFNK